jgi:hypothetical protein
MVVNPRSMLFGIEANPGSMARKLIPEGPFQHGNSQVPNDYIKRARFLRPADRVPVGGVHTKERNGTGEDIVGWSELVLYSWPGS